MKDEGLKAPLGRKDIGQKKCHLDNKGFKNTLRRRRDKVREHTIFEDKGLKTKKKREEEIRLKNALSKLMVEKYAQNEKKKDK